MINNQSEQHPLLQLKRIPKDLTEALSTHHQRSPSYQLNSNSMFPQIVMELLIRW